GESSAAVRARVVAARDRQRQRYGSTGPRTNADLTSSLLAEYCGLDGPGLRMLSVAVRRLALRARGYDRVRRVARTITGLAGADNICADHVAEALHFRMTM